MVYSYCIMLFVSPEKSGNIWYAVIILRGELWLLNLLSKVILNNFWGFKTPTSTYFSSKYKRYTYFRRKISVPAPTIKISAHIRLLLLLRQGLKISAKGETNVLTSMMIYVIYCFNCSYMENGGQCGKIFRKVKWWRELRIGKNQTCRRLWEY